MNTDRKEADMGYVKDFVGLIAQALVDASELPKQIEAIRSDMAGLTADLERTKARNVELDTMLNDTRRQRDEAEQALSQVKNDFTKAEANAHNVSVQLDHVLTERDGLKNQLELAKKERDDYGLKHMAAEDRANEAEGKLKKLREALGMPEEAKPIEPKPQTSGVTQAEPTPQAPPSTSKRVYEGETGFNDLDHKTENFETIPNGVGRWYRTA